MIVPNVERFIGAVIGISLIFSGALMAGIDVGGLVFAVSPLTAAVIVRVVGGDGLRGVGLNWTGKHGWYWLAIVMFPAEMSVSVGLGLPVDAAELRKDVSFASVGTATLAALVPRTVLAVGEEFGWRGYLTPLLHANRVPPLANHVIVGVTWTIWHVPFILASPTFTNQPLWVFVPLFILGGDGDGLHLGRDPTPNQECLSGSLRPRYRKCALLHVARRRRFRAN